MRRRHNWRGSSHATTTLTQQQHLLITFVSSIRGDPAEDEPKCEELPDNQRSCWTVPYAENRRLSSTRYVPADPIIHSPAMYVLLCMYEQSSKDLSKISTRACQQTLPFHSARSSMYCRYSYPSQTLGCRYWCIFLAAYWILRTVRYVCDTGGNGRNGSAECPQHERRQTTTSSISYNTIFGNCRSFQDFQLLLILL